MKLTLGNVGDGGQASYAFGFVETVLALVSSFYLEFLFLSRGRGRLLSFLAIVPLPQFPPGL